MRFTCPRQELADALMFVNEAVSARSPRPVLQNVKLGGGEGQLTLSGSDLEMALSYRLSIDDLIEPETILAPAARLVGIMREGWGDTAGVVVDGLQMTISGGRAKFQLSGQSPEDFPEIPPFDKEKTVFIHGDDFADAFQKTAFATAKGDTRYALNGIFVRIDGTTIEFVSSDTHRLSLVKKKIRNPDGAQGEGIAILKGMSALAKAAAGQESVALKLTSRELMAETEKATVILRLVEGQFPRYRDVIPQKAERKITVSREELLKNLRIAGLLSNEETRAVQLEAGDGKLLISSSGGDSGAARVDMDAEVEGGDVSIRFKVDLFVDFLRVMADDTVTIHLKDGQNPIRVDSGDFTHVVMPLVR